MEPAENVGAGTEFYARGVDVAGQDDGCVGEVETWGGNVEDCDDGLSGAEGDAVEEDAEYYYEPDCVDWGVGVWVYLGPEPVLCKISGKQTRGLMRYRDRGRASSRANA